MVVDHSGTRSTEAAYSRPPDEGPGREVDRQGESRRMSQGLSLRVTCMANGIALLVGS